jgi:hypothetical protein
MSDTLALLAPYTRRWQIDAHPAGLDIWSATWRSDDRRHIRVLVARSAQELAAKLEAAAEELDQMLGEADHVEMS